MLETVQSVTPLRLSDDIPDDVDIMDVDNCRWCGWYTMDYNEEFSVWVHPECFGDYLNDRQPLHYGD